MNTSNLPQVKVGDDGEEKFLEAFVLTAETIVSAFLSNMRIESEEEDLQMLAKIDAGELSMASQGIVEDGDGTLHFPIGLMNESGEIVAVHPLYFDELTRVCLMQILRDEKLSNAIYGKGDEIFKSTNWKINYYLAEGVEEMDESVPYGQGTALFTLLVKGELKIQDEVIL